MKVIYQLQENDGQHIYWPGIDADIHDIHKEMPGMYQEVPANQGGTANLMTSQRDLGRRWLWLILIWMILHMFVINLINLVNSHSCINTKLHSVPS